MDEATTTTYDFSLPNRQSPIAVFLIVQKLIQQLIRQFWPILLIYILNNLDFQAKSNDSTIFDSYFTNVLFFIAGLSTIGSIISYFKFYYYVQDDEFVIEKGILQKKKINIPFDRIQTINFEQNLIHQAFNVVSLEVDSAGTVQKEIAIQAISRERAEAIRTFIMREKAKRQVVDNEQDETTISAEITEPPAQTLMHLRPMDLLKIGVSQNHFQGLGIIFGFGFWIWQTLEDFLPDYRQGENPMVYLERDLGLGSIISMWTYLIVLLILFSVLISLVMTVFRFFDMQFFRTSAGFKVVSGLFTKREQSANFNKIQLIRWEDSILKRIFGIFRLHLFQASSAAVNIRQSINVPGCYQPQIDTVRATYFPDEKNYQYTTHGISSKIIGRRVLYLGGIPALIIVLNGYLSESLIIGLLSIVWIGIIYATSLFVHRNWKFHIHEEGILTEHGILGTEFTLLKWYKIQAVKTRQSIYQRRHDLADLYFYTAAGTVKIPYVPLEKARQITNFVLYRVETDERSWM
ncbi:MAG: PH domain-containing protein [Bacteroidota bacterium]